MVKRSRERASDRFVSIGLSVLVHAAIIGALFWGWWQYRHSIKTPPPTLAIEGTVVRHAPPQQRSPALTHPSPAPTPPAPPPTPPVDQAKLAQQHAADQAAAAKLAAQKAAAAEAAQQAQQQAAAKAAAKAAEDQAAKAEADREAEAKRKADEAARQAKLAAERKAKEEADLKAKQEAAREAQQLAQQLKAEQAEQQREADLHSQMQAEEHLDALERGPAEAEYLQLIQARISRAWIRPPSAQPGLKCIVRITQIPGGEITNVTVQSCNGDEAVRQSVQTAAYRASPLPAPPDPALFNPNITVTFAPDE